MKTKVLKNVQTYNYDSDLNALKTSKNTLSKNVVMTKNSKIKTFNKIILKKGRINSYTKIGFLIFKEQKLYIDEMKKF